MKLLKLNDGRYAVIDDEDFSKVSQYNWYAYENKSGNTMITHSIRVGKKYVNIYLSRLIKNAPVGMVVDHINGDCFDNRKNNLRICTSGQNSRNRKIPKNNTSGLKGVRPTRSGKKWQSQIVVNGKNKHLGHFDTKVEAAKAYDNAAITFFGEFARTNKSMGL